MYGATAYNHYNNLGATMGGHYNNLGIMVEARNNSLASKRQAFNFYVTATIYGSAEAGESLLRLNDNILHILRRRLMSALEEHEFETAKELLVEASIHLDIKDLPASSIPGQFRNSAILLESTEGEMRNSDKVKALKYYFYGYVLGGEGCKDDFLRLLEDIDDQDIVSEYKKLYRSITPLTIIERIAQGATAFGGLGGVVAGTFLVMSGGSLLSVPAATFLGNALSSASISAVVHALKQAMQGDTINPYELVKDMSKNAFIGSAVAGYSLWSNGVKIANAAATTSSSIIPKSLFSKAVAADNVYEMEKATVSLMQRAIYEKAPIQFLKGWSGDFFGRNVMYILPNAAGYVKSASYSAYQGAASAGHSAYDRLAQFGGAVRDKAIENFIRKPVAEATEDAVHVAILKIRGKEVPSKIRYKYTTTQGLLDFCKRAGAATLAGGAGGAAGSAVEMAGDAISSVLPAIDNEVFNEIAGGLAGGVASGVKEGTSGFVKDNLYKLAEGIIKGDIVLSEDVNRDNLALFLKKYGKEYLTTVSSSVAGAEASSVVNIAFEIAPGENEKSVLISSLNGFLVGGAKSATTQGTKALIEGEKIELSEFVLEITESALEEASDRAIECKKEAEDHARGIESGATSLDRVRSAIMMTI